MKFSLSLVCWLAVLCLCISPAISAATIGPIGDYKGTLENPTDTDFRFPIATILPTKPYYDLIWVEIKTETSSITALGVGWVTSDEPDTGLEHITTMYGVDLNPSGTELHMTGFDAAQAAAIRFYDERFIGNSGTIYPGVSLGTPAIADVPALFPGFDLSLFAGDPSSVVYAFRTTVPRSDFVPEPSGLLLLAGGGLIALLWRRRFTSRQKCAA